MNLFHTGEQALSGRSHHPWDRSPCGAIKAQGGYNQCPRSHRVKRNCGPSAAQHSSLPSVALKWSRDNAEQSCSTTLSSKCAQSACRGSEQEADLRAAVLGLCSLSILQQHQPEPKPTYERLPRRWLGLRPGKLILVEQQIQQQTAIESVWADAQRVAPSEAWTAMGGFLLATLLHWVVAELKGRLVRRTQREEAQRQAVQQAQKASYRHRSRFQRALGGPTGADASAAELGCEDYDGMPEDSSGQPADREEELSEEEEDEEEPWEYDSEVLKQWEQFVKKSKATQVSDPNWWDMDSAALDDRTLAASQEARDWNA